MSSSKSVVVFALLSVASLSQAGDLGQVGPVYPIAEESALDTIMNKLRSMERSGELKRLQEEAVTRSVKSAKEPRPVDGLAVVREASRRTLDPTITYDQAVTTDDGAIVVPAGARINPLLVTRLSKRLVFFDGRDKAQSEAVRRMVLRDGKGVKPILVAGSWFDTSKAWKTQVFFDQYGRLSKRFGIRAVPSVVSQDGALLVIQEVPGKDLK